MLAASRWLWSSLSVLAAQGCAAAPAADVPPAPHAASQTAVERDAPASAQTHGQAKATADPSPQPGSAWTAFPIATNCQAKLALTEEVSRLLTRAAAHSTHSRACVDGPGSRYAATDILVCPAAGDGSDQVVSVYYRMARYPEGDTRGCGTGERSCDWLAPTATEHQFQLQFETGASASAQAGMVRLRAPTQVPGMSESATALDAAHDGACYGASPPFAAGWVRP